MSLLWDNKRKMNAKKLSCYFNYIKLAIDNSSNIDFFCFNIGT